MGLNPYKILDTHPHLGDHCPQGVDNGEVHTPEENIHPHSLHPFGELHLLWVIN